MNLLARLRRRFYPASADAIINDPMAPIARAAYRSEADLLQQLTVYDADRPHCDQCVVTWDSRGDRCGLIPCKAYPACTMAATAERVGRHRRDDRTEIITIAEWKQRIR